MAASPATVRLRTPEGRWIVVGPEGQRGIVAERLNLTANEWGPDTATFTLRRKTRTAWPDLTAYNQMEVEIGGPTVWGGRIVATPTRDDEAISVEARGWQYHLSDDVLRKVWVQTDLAAWQDPRSATTTCPLDTFTSAYNVQVGGGGMQFSFPSNVQLNPSTRCAAFIDAGYAGAIKRVVVTYQSSNDRADMVLVIDESDSKHGTWGSTVIAANNAGAGPTTYSRTIPSAVRYLTLGMRFDGGGAVTPTTEVWFKVTACLLFASTAYESGGASILKAWNVIADVLASGALPLLSQSTARISASSFNIPDFAPDGFQSPRQLMEAVNAYHNWLVGVNAQREVYFRARPTVPLYEVGAWSGQAFDDASANSGDDLYNRVIVQFTGPDGSQNDEVRTATNSLLTRQGFTRAKILPVQAALTQVAAQQIGDVWLASKGQAPLRGGMAATRGSVRLVAGGAPVHPAHLLLAPGERLRLTDRVDPAGGAMGRDGGIVGVGYDHDSETATLQVDDRRDRMETFLERLAVVTGQVR